MVWIILFLKLLKRKTLTTQHTHTLYIALRLSIEFKEN